MISRVFLVTCISLAHAVATIATILVPLVMLIAIAPWAGLEFREPVQAGARLASHYFPVTGGTLHAGWRIALLWLLPGLLFLRYQLHTDRRALNAARRGHGAVPVEIAGLTDFALQSAVILLAGPLILLIRLFQRPVYAFVSDQRHHRDRVAFTAGRQGEAASSTRILFDSKSYLFGQGIELIVWGLCWLVLVFRTDSLPLAG